LGFLSFAAKVTRSSLCNLCVLCVSVVKILSKTNHRDTEAAQRQQFATDF